MAPGRAGLGGPGVCRAFGTYVGTLGAESNDTVKEPLWSTWTARTAGGRGRRGALHTENTAGPSGRCRIPRPRGRVSATRRHTETPASHRSFTAMPGRDPRSAATGPLTDGGGAARRSKPLCSLTSSNAVPRSPDQFGPGQGDHLPRRLAPGGPAWPSGSGQRLGAGCRTVNWRVSAQCHVIPRAALWQYPAPGEAPDEAFAVEPADRGGEVPGRDRVAASLVGRWSVVLGGTRCATPADLDRP